MNSDASIKSNKNNSNNQNNKKNHSRDGIHAKLSAYPHSVDSSDVGSNVNPDTTGGNIAESRRSNTRFRSNSVFESNTRSSDVKIMSRQRQEPMAIPKSYDGARSSPFIFRDGIQPAPQLNRVHSSTIPGMSSISYCGYLYKRSNKPQRTVDALQQEQRDHYGHMHRPIHEVYSASGVPEFPVMPEISLNSGNDTSVDHTNSERIALDHDQDGKISAFNVHSLPARNDSITGLAQSLQPLMHQQQQQCTLSPPRDESKKTIAKNPIQIGLEMGAAFFGIDLKDSNHKDGDDNHSEEIDFDPISPPTEQTIGTMPGTDNNTEARVGFPKTTTVPIKFRPSNSRNVPGEIPSARQPIPMITNEKSSSSTSPFHESLHRLCSESSQPLSDVSITNGNDGIPHDFVDPEDGHLWRAKYCVLEDGILYFYRNAHDGNHAEAAAERRKNTSTLLGANINQTNDSTFSTSYSDLIGNDGNIRANNRSNKKQRPLTSDTTTSRGQLISGISALKISVPSAATTSRRRSSAHDLSKSPMVRPGRNLLHHIDPSGFSLPDIDPDIDNRIYWEKRVVMDCVRGVRTAERQYGLNSFELLAMDDEDSDEDSSIDTLVLKGQNPTEMKEWIFQFHRTLATFMRNFIDNVGSTSTRTSGTFFENRRPSSDMLSSSLSASDLKEERGALPQSLSEKHLTRLISTSPSLNQTVLSHGHGRISLKRRMDLKRSSSGSASLSSTPDAGDMDYSTIPFAITDPSPGNIRTSPSSPTTSRHLIPPPTQRPFLNKAFMSTDSKNSRDPDLPPTKSSPVDPDIYRPKQSSNTNKYVPPHQRSKSKYLPPHLRRQQNQQSQGSFMGSSSALNNGQNNSQKQEEIIPSTETVSPPTQDKLDIVNQSTTGFVLGGCADPLLLKGSILDAAYIPKKASRLEKTISEAYGSFGGGFSKEKKASNSSLRWEVGAISECGVRESNEDSYILTNDLLNAFDSASYGSEAQTAWKEDDTDHSVGLFGIFDGHCGNQGARFAVEQLGRFIHSELQNEIRNIDENPFSPSNMESVLHEAIVKMDDEFCKLCQQGGREWESGATALVALLANENLVIASLGDCRGFFCRFVENNESYESDGGWEELEIGADDFFSSSVEKGSESEPLQRCFWREVTTVHSPSAEQERARIEQANGWITTETEIPIGQFGRMDFHDEDVIGILKRCMRYPSSTGESFTDSERSTKECKAAPQRIIHISRVCGELAVSRALGDRDFKAGFNSSSTQRNDDIDKLGRPTFDHTSAWESPLWLTFPENHDCRFRGDLVINTPDFHRVRLGKEGVSMEFLLLACDGLWDVMDGDDAIRVVRDLLYRKNVTAKKAAARLAELAIHLGSSDNITVVLVRLFSRNDIE